MTQDIVPLDEARASMLDLIPERPPEVVPLATASGRVLARDYHAPRDLPREARSRMDGYAASSADLRAIEHDRPIRLALRPEVAAAGHGPKARLELGEAIRILTGAPLPAGADLVIPDEEVVLGDGRVTIGRPLPRGAWVQHPGTDVRRGEPVASAGMLLTPSRLALLASFGYAMVPVFQRPRVGILGTGDELLELGETFTGPSHYCNSRYLLQWLVQDFGGTPVVLGNAADESVRVAEILGRCDADLIITTGGTGFGDRDVVLQAWNESEIDIVFRRVGISPGKNSAFGVAGETGYLALSGVPWAAEAVFLELAVPWLRAFQGIAGSGPRKIPAVLSATLENRRRLAHVIPGRLDPTSAPPQFDPLPRKGLAVYATIRSRNAYVLVPADATLMKGCIVQARRYDSQQ